MCARRVCRNELRQCCLDIVVVALGRIIIITEDGSADRDGDDVLVRQRSSLQQLADLLQLLKVGQLAGPGLCRYVVDDLLALVRDVCEVVLDIGNLTQILEAGLLLQRFLVRCLRHLSVHGRTRG